MTLQKMVEQTIEDASVDALKVAVVMVERLYEANPSITVKEIISALKDLSDYAATT